MRRSGKLAETLGDLNQRAFRGHRIDEAGKLPIAAILDRAKDLVGLDRQTIRPAARFRRALKGQMEGSWIH